MAWCLTRCERYLKLLSHISHVWALSPSVFLSWVPTYHTSGHLLLWRLSSVFYVIVSPGKGSSQGSLTCPHAQGLLYRPVLEDYPPTSFQMLLLQVLQLEMFSPLQSPAYTKARGLSLKQRERVPEGPSAAPLQAHKQQDTWGLSTGCPRGDPRVTGCTHLPPQTFLLYVPAFSHHLFLGEGCSRCC